ARPVTGSPYLTRGSRLALAGVTLVLAALSAIARARLYHPGYDPTRDYEGTDTRAFGLLIGAALAIVWPTRGWSASGRAAGGASVGASVGASGGASGGASVGGDR